jgi:hypothetical protein
MCKEVVVEILKAFKKMNTMIKFKSKKDITFFDFFNHWLINPYHQNQSAITPTIFHQLVFRILLAFLQILRK